jgi:hypothetical protein
MLIQDRHQPTLIEDHCPTAAVPSSLFFGRPLEMNV